MLPTLWVGPANSGKVVAARAAFGTPPATRPRLCTLDIGDYAARFWEFPTHMEIDVLDLSMMDKQILPELVRKLMATRDVVDGSRKKLLLRRIHGLSPAAATRLRACLEELVWHPSAPALVCCTARVVNSVVATVMDGFVYRRCSLLSSTSSLRGALQEQLGVATPARVATPATYIADVFGAMVRAKNSPSLAMAEWIRARVYELLGLMVGGGDLVTGLTWATVRMAAAGEVDGPRAVRVLDTLSRTRWLTSYRTPLIMEYILTMVYQSLIG